MIELRFIKSSLSHVESHIFMFLEQIAEKWVGHVGGGSLYCSGDTTEIPFSVSILN